MICYRPNRRWPANAMAEAREFNSISDMLQFICDEHNSLIGFWKITPEELCLSYDYCEGGDPRVGWNNIHLITFERPSKIKNIHGYMMYFGIDADKYIKDDLPVGVIGMFTTDYIRDQKNLMMSTDDTVVSAGKTTNRLGCSQEDFDRIYCDIQNQTYKCSICGDIVFPEVDFADGEVTINKYSASVVGAGDRCLMPDVCPLCQEKSRLYDLH